MSSVNRSLRAVFSKSRQRELKTTIAIKNSISDESNLNKAVTRFKKACEQPTFRHNQDAYRLTVRRLAAANKLSVIEDILELQKSFDDIRSEGFVARLIRLYGQSAMFDHARKLFDEMPFLNCDRTIVSFNALLKAALDSKKFESVIDIFNDLPEKVSIEPDLISHNIVIHAYCSMNDLDNALVTFSSLKNPDLFTFNTLLNALYKSGRFHEGETLFASMESKNVVPDVRSYNTKLRGIFHENSPLKADEVLAEMESNGIRPDIFSYNALINGYCDNGDTEEAMKWYRELQRNECAPNYATLVKLIPSCCNNGDVDTALELCMEAVSRRLLLKLEVFKQVMNGLVVEDKTEEASKLVDSVNSAKFMNYKLNPLLI